jgi:hypothetical protein
MFFCEVESNVYVLFRWNPVFKGLKPEESSLLLAVFIIARVAVSSVNVEDVLIKLL